MRCAFRFHFSFHLSTFFTFHFRSECKLWTFHTSFSLSDPVWQTGAAFKDLNNHVKCINCRKMNTWKQAKKKKSLIHQHVFDRLVYLVHFWCPVWRHTESNWWNLFIDQITRWEYLFLVSQLSQIQDKSRYSITLMETFCKTSKAIKRPCSRSRVVVWCDGNIWPPKMRTNIKIIQPSLGTT